LNESQPLLRATFGAKDSRRCRGGFGAGCRDRLECCGPSCQRILQQRSARLGSERHSQLTGAAAKTGNIAPMMTRYTCQQPPIQGQTFQDGGNANGYSLTAVTLKQVAYETYALVPDMSTPSASSPSGSTVKVLAEETAAVPEDATDCSTCNFPTVNGGNNPGPGSGRFITFTFATPAVLNQIRLRVRCRWQEHFPLLGDGWTSNSNAYAEGTAYSSGSDGIGGSSMTAQAGDRVLW